MDLRDIRGVRKVRGLSIEELSVRTGINRDRISLIERGLVNPSYGSVIKILDSLGCSIKLDYNG